MKRQPAHAGTFYPDTRESLIDAIEKAFMHRLGPGELPPRPPPPYKGSAIGIMSPHAGYMYSGHVAAHGYLRLAEAGEPEVVFLIGPNHYGYGSPIALDESEYWVTPLGEVEVDVELEEEMASLERLFAFDFTAHKYEHSLEVQLPFLQYVFGDEFKIVPISMMLQSPEAASRVGRTIARVIEEHGLKAYVVASSDMSHYVDARIAREKDMRAISRILELDVEGLYRVVVEEDVSMCGVGPVMSLIEVARGLGYTSPRLLQYANSGDVTGDYRQVVAYASIIFERAKA